MATTTTKAATAARVALAAAAKDPGAEKTIKAAEAVVALRQCFEHNGGTDWSGRSPGYRDMIARLYRDAGVPSDSESNMQANLRYHIGNAVRRAAPAEELVAAGLTKAGPLDRIKEDRVAKRAERRTAAAVTSAGDPVALTRLALDAVRAALTMAPTPNAGTRKNLEAIAQEVADALHQEVDHHRPAATKRG